MSKLFVHRSWRIPEREATPESVFQQRRSLLKAVGFVGLGLAGLIPSACGPAGDAAVIGAQENPPAPELYPVPRNSRYPLDRALTDEAYAASYNNFYEFTVFKGSVYKRAARLRTSPWEVEVGGLVEKPRVFDIADLIRAMPLEERLYRLRCVEAWAMAVPWTGFPLHLDDRLWPEAAVDASDDLLLIDLTVVQAALEFLVPEDTDHPPVP